MYKVKEELVDMLKNGRTLNYLSEEIAITPQYMSNIFKGYKCSKLIAKGLISVREKIAINDDRMEGLLEYYFDKV